MIYKEATLVFLNCTLFYIQYTKKIRSPKGRKICTVMRYVIIK